MKSRFKHFIALTALLAIGQVSFGQQYPQRPTLNYRDVTGDHQITGIDSALCEYEYNGALEKYYRDVDYYLEKYCKFTEERYTEIPQTIDVEKVYNNNGCDHFTITWKGKIKPQYYGIILIEDPYEIKDSKKTLHDNNNTELPHNKFSYYIKVDPSLAWSSNTTFTFTFTNLQPDTEYEVTVFGYNYDPKGFEIVEQSKIFDSWTDDIKISTPDKNGWGAAGSAIVTAPYDCEVIKWDYDRNVLVQVGTNKESNGYYGKIKFTSNFEVLKYNTKTKVTATIRCKSSGHVYTRDITVTIKPLNLYCESKVWRCNSVIKMNLENAPASLKTVKWTSSDNLQICYSGFNNTIKYAYFQAKGTGSAWIKASFTYNGITYTKQFSYSIIPKSASYMANKPITDVYTDSTDVLLLSVDELNMESQESSFIVYPNPATTELNIKQTVSSGNLSLEEDGAIKTVDIFDVKGNKCASHVFNDAQTTATIDITDLANGIFILVINKDSDDAQTCSFVKK